MQNVGVAVVCSVCGLVKKPIGRDAGPEGGFCDWECPDIIFRRSLAICGQGNRVKTLATHASHWGCEMKLGTQISFRDGRVGTVVYNSLIGVGIKWGLHNPLAEDFVGTDGNTVSSDMPDGWTWEPEALLRAPWEGCEKHGFSAEQCVGIDYEVTRIGGVR